MIADGSEFIKQPKPGETFDPILFFDIMFVMRIKIGYHCHKRKKSPFGIYGFLQFVMGDKLRADRTKLRKYIKDHKEDLEQLILCFHNTFQILEKGMVDGWIVDLWNREQWVENNK